MRREQELLEEPRSVRPVPLRRTRVRHRLHDLVLGAERRSVSARTERNALSQGTRGSFGVDAWGALRTSAGSVSDRRRMAAEDDVGGGMPKSRARGNLNETQQRPELAPSSLIIRRQ